MDNLRKQADMTNATRECPRCSTHHQPGQKVCAETFDRLLNRRRIVDGCWEFTGSLSTAGYGRLWIRDPDRRYVYAHRYSYEVHKGPIPDGLHLDHLCRNRACFNPDHLEAVTPRENVLRGEAPTAITARTNTCPRGHDMADAIIRGDGTGRMCRECNKIRNRAAYPQQKIKRRLARESRSR